VSEPVTLELVLDGRRRETRVKRGVTTLPAARSGRIVARDDAGNRSRAVRIGR
jgi:hypothetical protein